MYVFLEVILHRRIFNILLHLRLIRNLLSLTYFVLRSESLMVWILLSDVIIIIIIITRNTRIFQRLTSFRTQHLWVQNNWKIKMYSAGNARLWRNPFFDKSGTCENPSFSGLCGAQVIFWSICRKFEHCSWGMSGGLALSIIGNIVSLAPKKKSTE